MAKPPNSETDPTKEVLEQLLAQLYAEQANTPPTLAGTQRSCLIADDGQFLGNISDNQYDRESILNQYGPYGSQYSPTSIFNPYSKYGSPYGQYSIQNPYTSTPPHLFIAGREIARVTANPYIPNRMPPEAFLFALKNDIHGLLQGSPITSEPQARQAAGQSYIQAENGQFLGKLNPNKFDNDSIFNTYGPYGNKFSNTCIFNKFSDYGSQFSALSPYNQFAATPPKLFVNGQFVAYLTVNSMLTPRVHPDHILEWAEQNVSKYAG